VSVTERVYPTWMAIYTAVRIFKGSSPYVVVYADGVEIDRLGGKRAGRAVAALVGHHPIYHSSTPCDVLGLRSDLDRAQSEAASLLKIRKRYPDSPTYDWAIAVPVVDTAQIASTLAVTTERTASD